MTSDQLRRVHNTRPFRRFVLRLADGTKIGVRHPECLSYSPSGRTAVVFGDKDDFEIIDLLLVAAIEVGGNGARKH